jgi:F-type H+-transporting ATPase subunit gamma
LTDTKAILQRQIAGAAQLKTVVRTMKAQAAANISQYERSVSALADYQRGVESGISAVLQRVESRALLTELRRTKPGSSLGAIVFGSDQGLVGRFNDVIGDYAVQTLATLHRPATIWAVGQRVQDRLADANHEVEGLFAVPASVGAVASLVGQILLQTEHLRSQSPGAELYLFYNSRGPGATYAPISQRLLPLDATWLAEQMEHHWPTRSVPDMLGELTTTLQALIGEHLFIGIFRACAESLASEYASRLAAMQRAEKNIGDRLEGLNATFHRLRQSSIDEELFDVISAVEALTGPLSK